MTMTDAAASSDRQDRDRREEHATKLVLTTVFFGTIGAFAVVPALRRSTVLRLGPLDLVLLGLTTYRVGHLVAYERIADPIREPFAERTPDPEGDGETIVPKGSGVQRALGELLSCPICVGTWAATALVYGLHLLPRPTRAFMAIMTATGIAQIVNTAVKALGAVAH